MPLAGKGTKVFGLTTEKNDSVKSFFQFMSIGTNVKNDLIKFLFVVARHFSLIYNFFFIKIGTPKFMSRKLSKEMLNALSFGIHHQV